MPSPNCGVKVTWTGNENSSADSQRNPATEMQLLRCTGSCLAIMSAKSYAAAKWTTQPPAPRRIMNGELSLRDALGNLALFSLHCCYYKHAWPRWPVVFNPTGSYLAHRVNVGTEFCDRYHTGSDQRLGPLGVLAILAWRSLLLQWLKYRKALL